MGQLLRTERLCSLCTFSAQSYFRSPPPVAAKVNISAMVAATATRWSSLAQVQVQVQ